MKRHALDIVSLVFGVIFVGVAVTGMFVDEDVTVLEARWVWPALLVLAGAVILLFTIRGEDTGAGTPSQPGDPVE